MANAACRFAGGGWIRPVSIERPRCPARAGAPSPRLRPCRSRPAGGSSPAKGAPDYRPISSGRKVTSRGNAVHTSSPSNCSTKNGRMPR